LNQANGILRTFPADIHDIRYMPFGGIAVSAGLSRLHKALPAA
jgi:hypothetical protein